MVLFHPPTRFPDRGWHENPDVAAWLGTSRRVCDGYSRHLAGLGVQGRYSLLQLRPEVGTEDLTAGGVVRATVNVDRFEGLEFGHVDVPHGVRGLSPEQRGHLVLETVHALVVRLGEFRGWTTADVAPARDRTLADGCAFTVEGPWKSAPGRSRSARVVHRLADAGFGRATLEVRSADGSVVEIGPALSFSTGKGFERSVGTLRWHGKDAVEAVPYDGLFGDQRGLLRWTADGSSVAEPPPLPKVSELPTMILDDVPARVVAEATGDVLGVPVEIRSGGGGPTNGVPGDYLVPLHHLFGAVTGDVWQEWWRPPGERRLQLGYNFAPRRPGHSIRRTGQTVGASIDRPTPTMVAAPDRVQLALDDVVGLMTAIGSRFGLGPLPGLPTRDEVAAQTAEEVAYYEQKQAEENRERLEDGARFKAFLEAMGIDPPHVEVVPE